jgi:hypothetical protein
MKGMVSPVSLLLHGGPPCPPEDKPENGAAATASFLFLEHPQTCVCPTLE